jgi:GT2 family glycosyltransferase
VISVVVSTYAYPRALDAVLGALCAQSESAFEVIVSEDGRDRETADVVAVWRSRFGDRLIHLCQDDVGFRLARARDRAARVSRGSHLAFLDGDCVPRRHFVRALRRAARPGWFGATYRYELSEDLTTEVLRRDERLHRWGMLAYVRNRRRMRGYPQWLTVRDRRRVGTTRGEDFVPPYENYGFLVVDRTDFETVNGYDMRYEGWGGEDVDLAYRLRHLGVRCGWPGPDATLFHLWHPSRKDTERRYLTLLRACQSERRVEAAVGLRELDAEERAAVTPDRKR